MAQTYEYVDQSTYVSLGGLYGSYGVHQDILKFEAEFLKYQSESFLNQVVPMIHFNRKHLNEDGEPVGFVKVRRVSWAKSSERKDRVGVNAIVRLRSLPLGAVGTNKTLRRKFTAEEVKDMCLKHIAKQKGKLNDA